MADQRAGSGSRLRPVDADIRAILKAWSQDPDRERARQRLAEAASALSESRRKVLIERMAEVALGFLAVLDDQWDT